MSDDKICTECGKRPVHKFRDKTFEVCAVCGVGRIEKFLADPEGADEMNESELNRWIAENIRGWKECAVGSVYAWKDTDNGLHALPNFCHDLNACYAAEERIKEMGKWMWAHYLTDLGRILDCQYDLDKGSGLWKVCHASAIDRCRAMVLAVRGVGR